jgi:DNA segregation ATPase FtsK/SpoIIIE-like protein
MNDIDYQCIIESIFDDDMKEKEKIFKEFAKEFKNLDGLINDAIILMQKRKCKTPVSYLQRKLQIGYNRAAKIKNQVCMFGLLEEKEEK